MSSQSLVADYESSSSENENESTKISQEESTVQLASALEMLAEDNLNVSSSVFSNPYREAENYEQALLEQHVKMTSIKEKDNVKQKKICFKFNKGKCRLGDKCLFLHHNPNVNINEQNISKDADVEITKPMKKRSGIKDDLVPPKKFMKTHYQTK